MIAYRLVNILRKLLYPNETVDRFAKVKKHSMETLKEIIFELSSKCDELQI